jgi:hypothetical protein
MPDLWDDDMLFCVRTTLDLEDHLMHDAKVAARAAGTTLTAFVEDALRERLARRDAPVPAKQFRLRTFTGTGVQSGVDLDNSAGLRDLMDGLA